MAKREIETIAAKRACENHFDLASVMYQTLLWKLAMKYF